MGSVHVERHTMGTEGCVGDFVWVQNTAVRLRSRAYRMGRTTGKLKSVLLLFVGLVTPS